MHKFKEKCLNINKNLVCKKVETPRHPLYQVWDKEMNKQITDGNYSASAAWHSALYYLLKGSSHE